MTKDMDKTASGANLRIEVGLVCAPGTSPTGLHGLMDLFMYANEFAAKRSPGRAQVPVRLTHWRAEGEDGEVRCAYDSESGAPQALTVVILPGNLQATLHPVGNTSLIAWLRLKHAEGVVLAAVCGGVFILAKTGLLAGRQATTHWALRDQFASQYPDVLTETDHMVVDYGDVVTLPGTPVLNREHFGIALFGRQACGPASISEGCA